VRHNVTRTRHIFAHPRHNVTFFEQNSSESGIYNQNIYLIRGENGRSITNVGFTDNGFANIGKSNDGKNFLSYRQKVIPSTDRFRTVLRGRNAPVINMINNNLITITGVDLSYPIQSFIH